MDTYKVLCIDDDLPILMALRHFDWERCHCIWCGEAHNGKEALDLLPELKPDIVLVDIAMPIIDGLEFIRQAKGEYSSLHFIIISAHCDFNYARQAIRFGVTDYLAKGEYTDEELQNTLLKITRRDEIEHPYRFEVQTVIKAIEQQLQENITLEIIADQMKLTPNYLGTLFFKQTKKHFRDYLLEVRMERARELLLNSPLKIYEIAEQVGIQNQQYFCSVFTKYYGKSPSQFRR